MNGGESSESIYGQVIDEQKPGRWPRSLRSPSRSRLVARRTDAVGLGQAFQHVEDGALVFLRKIEEQLELLANSEGRKFTAPPPMLPGCAHAMRRWPPLVMRAQQQ